MLHRVGLESVFLDGLRVTSPDALDVVAMVLGLVNLRLVANLVARGVPAVGLSGADDGLVTATVADRKWGRVGSVQKVRPNVLVRRLEGEVPVLSPLAAEENGELLNCNADAIAGSISAALGAPSLILLSDVDQIRRDPQDPLSALGALTCAEAEELIASGAIHGGMRPKVMAAVEAVRAGARRVIVADGRQPHAIARALSGDVPHTEVTA
jgi:acetylglutamate kinase